MKSDNYTDYDEDTDECQHCFLTTEVSYCSLCSERLCMDCLDNHAEDCSEVEEDIA